MRARTRYAAGISLAFPYQGRSFAIIFVFGLALSQTPVTKAAAAKHSVITTVYNNYPVRIGSNQDGHRVD